MKKKDILFLCQFFYPEHNSSATLPFDTARYLAQHGYTVEALVGYPKEYSDEKNVPIRENKDGVGIRRMRYIQLARGKKLSRLINYCSFTMSAVLHLFQLRAYRCVIVYSNPPVLPIVPVLANLLFKTRIVFVAYDVYPEVAFASHSIGKGSAIDRGMQWINHMLYRRVSQVVALTDEMKAFLLENRTELTVNRVVTIANWAHEKKCDVSGEAFSHFGYTKDQFIVSYFGNMGICQEMDTLIHAAEQLKDRDEIQFLLIGHGNKKEQIAEYCKTKKLHNVQIIDFLTGTAFEQAVAVSSCCVVSLEKGLKGMCAPSKYYSYLQGGKPILAVVEEGSYLEQEIQREKIGAAASIGDAEALAQKILAMANSPAETKAMASRAQALYDTCYAYEIGMKKYAQMLNKVMRDTQ